MDPEHIRAYADRAWHLVAALKQEHWAREVAERGPDIQVDNNFPDSFNTPFTQP